MTTQNIESEDERNDWLDNRENDYERECKGENEPTDSEVDREIEYNRSQFGRIGQ